MSERRNRRWVVAVLLLAAMGGARVGVAADPLMAGFREPPESAKPRTWWHWTNGNVTKAGITKDLEWMKRVGIGGFMLADVGAGGGQTVEKKILFASPEWFDAVKFAASEADRLGLEMSIFSSAGWSETGGPWVKPEQAMKKAVWSEMGVKGPMHFSGKLPPPPSNNGPIGNLKVGRGSDDPTFYGESVVLAYRTPTDEVNLAELHPTVTSGGGAIDAAALFDDDLNSSVTVRAPEDRTPAFVQLAFEKPVTVRSVTIAARGGIPVGELLASEDGVTWRAVVELPGAQLYRGGLERTFDFPATTARFFKLEMTAAALGPAITMSQEKPAAAKQYVLNTFQLHSAARVHRWEEKAGYSFLYDYKAVPTPGDVEGSATPSAEVVNLTEKMGKGGTLEWDVPEGEWTILRMGYSLTGAKNRPAPPTGSGYEADKLSRPDVEAYFHGYFDRLQAALGPLYGKTLRNVMMDSWEAGMQNWTDDMIAQFKARRGYDPTPYLPAMTGQIVQSGDVSDRFLWDFRRTLADMFAENHFGTMADLLGKQGIGISAEAAGVSMEIMEDTLLNKSKVAIPMGEFWVHALHPELQYYVDVRGAASAAHAYGKPLVGTESFTGGGYESPATLKGIGDYWLAQGVNRFVFHTSAEQPLDTKPGNTMVGTHINRNITWAEQASGYMTYLARSCYLLQQGKFVADVAYLLPEGAPSSQPFWGGGLKPVMPEGYDYDCINTDVLLNRMKVGEGGKLVLPDGMSYRVLVLPETTQMTPALARKIRELVMGGATVIGPRPVSSPSLADYPKADGEVQGIAKEAWGDLDGVMRNRWFVGNGGCVVWNMPVGEVLRDLGVMKDAEFSQPLDSDTVWLHRHLEDGEVYYVANHSDKAVDVEGRFRVAGKDVRLWHADTGASELAGYSRAEGMTTVPLHLAEHESVFVVFRGAADASSRVISRPQEETIAAVDGAWEVAFEPKLGAPEKATFETLASWSANKDQGIRFFSGTGTYAKTVHLDAVPSRGRVMLYLGGVRDLAEVSVNGHTAGALWKAPYAVDVTSFVKAGDNAIEIKVTNEWTNRVMGDRQGAGKVLDELPPTFRPVVGKQEPLPSGLLGPVKFVHVMDSK